MPTPSSRRRKARVTSSRNRAANKPSTPKPVSTGSPRARAARARVSTAKVSSASNGKPTGSASGRVTTGRAGAQSAAKQPSPQAQDAKRWQQLNQSKSAKAGKAAEPKPRTPAPGTGNVLKSAQEFSKDKAAKDRQVARQAATNRTAQNRQAVGKAMTTLGSMAGGPKALAARAVLETVAPRSTAKGTVSAGGAQGPTMPKRLKEQGYAAQEKKAREKNAARKGTSFDDAFRDARRAKVKTFTWRGKKYTTEMK